MVSEQSIFQSKQHLRVLLAVFAVALLGVQLLVERPGSYDLISYLAAADVFAARGNPYGDDILRAARYDGLPFVYPPATLWVFYPLTFVSTKLALLLDGLARFAALGWGIAVIRRRLLPEVKLEHALFAALAFGPVLNAIVQANFVVYCFAALMGCVELADRPRTARRLVGAALCGFVLAFKPMWLVAGGFVFLARRNYAGLAAWLVGVSVIAAGSVAQPELFASWLQRVAELRLAFPLADIPTLAPTLYFALVAVWLIGTAILWFTRRDHPLLPLHAATSVLVWPRCDIHTHLIVLWLAAWVWQRHGLRTATLLAFPLLLPIPMALRAAGIQDLGNGFGWYPEILGYYVGTLALSVALWREVRKEGRA